MNRRSRLKEQALFGLAERGDVRSLRRLLQPRWPRPPVDPDRRNADGWTLLHTAAAYGQLPAARLLLARGADPAVRNYLGLTPLEYAACYGHELVAEALVQAGAHHTVSTAAALGANQALRRLLYAGAEPNDRDYFGYTPLHWAARHGQFEAARLLLQHGADPAVQDANGETPLHRATQWGHGLVANLLRQYGAAEIQPLACKQAG